MTVCARVQITMAITRFEERKERWDAGEVSSVSGVGEDFTKGQYWTREVSHHWYPVNGSGHFIDSMQATVAFVHA